MGKVVKLPAGVTKESTTWRWMNQPYYQPCFRSLFLMMLQQNEATQFESWLILGPVMFVVDMVSHQKIIWDKKRKSGLPYHNETAILINQYWKGHCHVLLALNNQDLLSMQWKKNKKIPNRSKTIQPPQVVGAVAFTIWCFHIKTYVVK